LKAGCLLCELTPLALQVGSIYSNYYASDAGSNLLDQLPFFVVVERLECEKARLVQERLTFQQDLQRYKGIIASVNQQLTVRNGWEVAQDRECRSQLRVCHSEG